jgi:hypothetical protein
MITIFFIMSHTQGIFAVHAKQVIEDDIEGKPAITTVADNQKVEEFIMYCQQVHPSSNSAVSNTSDRGKKIGFLFYQLCCSLQKKEGKKLDLKQKYSTNLNTLN